jgi:hypothetical protein
MAGPRILADEIFGPGWSRQCLPDNLHHSKTSSDFSCSRAALLGLWLPNLRQCRRQWGSLFAQERSDVNVPWKGEYRCAIHQIWKAAYKWCGRSHRLSGEGELLHFARRFVPLFPNCKGGLAASPVWQLQHDQDFQTDWLRWHRARTLLVSNRWWLGVNFGLFVIPVIQYGLNQPTQ